MEGGYTDNRYRVSSGLRRLRTLSSVCPRSTSGCGDTTNTLQNVNQTLGGRDLQTHPKAPATDAEIDPASKACACGRRTRKPDQTSHGFRTVSEYGAKSSNHFARPRECCSFFIRWIFADYPTISRVSSSHLSASSVRDLQLLQ